MNVPILIRYWEISFLNNYYSNAFSWILKTSLLSRIIPIKIQNIEKLDLYYFLVFLIKTAPYILLKLCFLYYIYVNICYSQSDSLSKHMFIKILKKKQIIFLCSLCYLNYNLHELYRQFNTLQLMQYYYCMTVFNKIVQYA